MNWQDKIPPPTDEQYNKFLKNLGTMKIKKTKIIVEKLLLAYPECRDNDLLLILKVWGQENPQLRKEYNFKDFAKDLLGGNHTNTETIRRTRCLLQRENVGLRGEIYNKRLENQNKVKWELGYK